MEFDSVSLGAAVAAIGALGTSAFGLVDALKTLPGGGISNTGYVFIEKAIHSLFMGPTRKGATGGMKHLFDTLHGNWINGTPISDQKAIAKSLVKLRLDATTADGLARATGVNAAILKTVGEKMSSGAKLGPEEVNVLGRFDLALAAILDDGYQHADQRYRNSAKLAAMIVSTILAVVGGCVLFAGTIGAYLTSQEIMLALIAGLLATPFAPMTKDLATALSAGVKVAQTIRK